ncbi:MAG: MBL fold metallo-hydrolase [Hyphomicrobium sp.]|nr:MAG: MBL fold metallo-hydrolase [Hyphomicrobium sp.]MBZ0209869.1 MBL fold metallo-hydrolase [Hyphomicrobium sp.]
MSESLKFNTAMQFAYGVPDIMAEGVARLVAPNAGPLTFKGTNTYLVGDRSLAVIDPGPADAAHLAAILAAAAGRPITHIFSTHAHRDHVDGIAALAAATGARTYAYRRSEIPHGGAGDAEAEYVGHGFTPNVHLKHGDMVAGEDWTLAALHTPGHAPDHLCLALKERGVVFSGDHVMAWNTSVVAPPEGRMSDYLRSLELLLERDERLLLPGHGGPIEESRRTVKAYLLHRKWREQAILDAVRKGTNTVRTLLPVIYRDLDESVVGAATLSLRAHIDHLAERGLIACADSSNVDCVAVPL